jgi:hypothetical protein
MNTEPPPSDRAAQFRKALVATANLGPYVRRRPPLKLVIGLVLAFVVAGALTGGTLAAAGTVDPAILTAQAGAAASGHQFVGMADGTLIGQPIIRTATGDQLVDVGTPPSRGATLVLGFECIDPGSFVWLVDGRSIATYPACEPDGGTGMTMVPVGSGGHTFAVKAEKSTRFVIWLSWMTVPKLSESAAEHQELADGVVTRDEYVAAFNRYEGCMAGLGHPNDRVPAGIELEYQGGEAAANDGSYARCYDTEFEGVDLKWQSELSTTDVGDTSIDACLAHFGVMPDVSPEARILQLQQLVGAAENCAWIG